MTNGTRLHTIDFSQIDVEKFTAYISFHGLKDEYNTITQSDDFQLVVNNIKYTDFHESSCNITNKKTIMLVNMILNPEITNLSYIVALLLLKRVR